MGIEPGDANGRPARPGRVAPERAFPGGESGGRVAGRRGGADGGTGRRGGDARGERAFRDRPGYAAVPPAEFRSYYGRPVIKAPRWRSDIPAYFYTGGLAAGSAMMAAGADATGRPVMRRAGRLAALGALGVSTWFLINDLGRKSRFHHMLRMAKPSSPMSMGTWILAGFGPAAGVAAAAELAHLLPEKGPLGTVRRVLPGAGRAAGYAAAGIAPALATYTAVLISNTAVPSWHEAYPELPFVFGGSALASAAGLGLMAAPPHEAAPARRLAVAGAAIELAAAQTIETRLGLLSEPYQEGRAGRLLRAGRNLTALGVLGALVGQRSRVLSAASGAALLVAPALTRFGIYHGGIASAEDPRYTVVPQRERLQRGQKATLDQMAGDLVGAASAVRALGTLLRRGRPAPRRPARRPPIRAW